MLMHQHHRNGAPIYSVAWDACMHDPPLPNTDKIVLSPAIIDLTSDDNCGGDSDGYDDSNSVSLTIVSVDPGRQHCAVVRYDAYNDRFEAAALLDLMCCCSSSSSNIDADHNYGMASTAGKTPSLWTNISANHKRKRTAKPPTVHEMARQTGRLIHGPGRQEIMRLFGNSDLLIIERQLPTNTAMMVVAGALENCYGGMARQGTQVMSPQANKKFWNAAAMATGTRLCFRKAGGHSKHKTDAKRMAARILSYSERSRFRRAAERNAAHKLHCPVHRSIEAQRSRKRRKQGRGATKKKTPSSPPIKTDDLMDAALQAIFAAQIHINMTADDKTGPAYRRLWHTRKRYRPHRRCEIQLV